MASKPQKFISNIRYEFEKTWDKNKTNVSFDLKNMNLSLVNAFRRTIIANVKSFGFRTEPYEKNQVDILKNDTSFNNQIMCHRIGMIPIHITDETFNIEDYEFIIDEENNTNFPKVITSKDIKIRQISSNKFLSEKECEKIFPKDPITGDHIIITKLKPSYNIINYKLDKYKNDLTRSQGKSYKFHMTAKACLSDGVENSRFSPCTAISHTYKIDEAIVDSRRAEYVKSEIEKTKSKGLKPKTEEELIRFFDTTYRERCFYQNEEGEATEFVFNLESIGVLPPLVIFYRAINHLIKKIDSFIINLTSKNDNVIQIEPSPNLKDGYKIVVLDEDDTFGNLISEHLYERYCTGDDPELDIIGYKRVHPLEDKIFFNVNSSKNKSFDEITVIFVDGCKQVIKKLNSIKNDLENKKEFVSEIKKI